MIQNFKLLEKNNLTENVYEMLFQSENKIVMKPGQFITFLLDKIWWRAYSILKIEWDKILLIIKKREKIEWWRWWSILICDLNIWETLRWVWPAWHFLLSENNKNKLFIWTGTGFVPLWNQIQWVLELKQDANIKLLFWVRESKDLFYEKEIAKLKNDNKSFDYDIYLSKCDKEWYNKWYTTNYLTKDNCSQFEEFYICWAPAMIESSVKILKDLWIDETNIYFEKY